MFLINFIMFLCLLRLTFSFCGDSIMDREKRLSILYQKQGRATQFANKAARDKWLQKEIDDLERVLLSNRKQVRDKSLFQWPV